MSLTGCQFRKSRKENSMDEMKSVKEQMPPSQVEVLLYDTAGYFRVGWWNDLKKIWVGRDVPQYAVITHWCHLPKRPKNQDDFAENSYFY